MYRLRIGNPVPRRFRDFKARVAIVIGVMTLALLVLAGRAVDLQVVRKDELTRIANRQSQRTLHIKGRRGAIEDRAGEPLALSIRAESFFVRPGLVEQPAQTAYRLARTLGLARETLEERISGDDGFVWLKRRVTPQEAQAVHALELPGVGSTREYLRVYPGRTLAAQILGFTGVDTQGLEGLEYAYDSFLRGADGLQVIDKDALGRTVLTSDGGNPTRGGSIALTIQPAVQYIAEQEVAKAVQQSEASLGIAIVIRSNTGEILAIAQAPSFNPNNYNAYDKETYFNRAMTNGYEPGSTFKVITEAIALEEKIAKPDTLFFCENGEFQHYDSVIHDTEPHGWLDMRGTLRLSSNICAAKLGLMIPAAVFREYVGRFGFGERTGVFTLPNGKRLAGEAEGYVLPVHKWTPVDHAAISFGHGVLVSPLQMAMAINTIATGGELLRPYLVKEVRDPYGAPVLFGERTKVRRVISQATAQLVRDFMVSVVEDEGTGTRAAIPGFQVAGKTGTTEKYEFQARGYSKTKQIVSFGGFVPAVSPELTILVVVEDPKRGRYGGTVAAPVFREIAQRALPLLGVWPTDGVRRVNLAAKVAAPALGE
jgi:cell division protein FtsI (penicillin-binding protein 3)